MSCWAENVGRNVGRPVRPDEEAVVYELLQNNHVFAALPLYSGGSLCYGAFPAVYTQVHPGKKAIVLAIVPPEIITPIHQLWASRGVKSVILKRRSDMTEKQVKAVAAGKYELLLAEPNVVDTKLWAPVLRSKSFREKIKVLAIEQVNRLYTGSTSFRPDYLGVQALRVVLPNALVLALTGPVIKEAVTQVSTQLGLFGKMTVVAPTPDRPEVFLRLSRVPSDPGKSLLWYVQLLVERQEAAPKAIIYTRSIELVTQLYMFLSILLGVQNDSLIDLVDLYHEDLDFYSKSRVLEEFSQANSSIRVVVATTAFGGEGGLSAPNVRYVLHWGPAHDPVCYVKEVGRCARDGRPGEAITYVYPDSLSEELVHPGVADFVKSSLKHKTCLREHILSYLHISGSGEGDGVPERGARCCCHCTERVLAKVAKSLKKV